jgi:CubicO group peptidase (beta-lactamase class C family)
LQPAFEHQGRQFTRAFFLLQDAVAQHAFPGAVLAVAHRGALIASKAVGHFTYDTGSPAVAPETIFDVASLTKVILTTTAAMLLHERGQLNLEATIERYLPEFVGLAPSHQQGRRRSATVHMLLAHSSGLPAYERLFEYSDCREDLVRAAMTTPLKADPGTRAEYSDIGFILLGEIVARQSGMRLEEFSASEILRPLKLESTTFNPRPELRSQIPPAQDDKTFRKRIIQGEVDDENASVMGGIAGHAGLFSQAADVARFAECMLVGGSPILQPATVALFTRREASPTGTSRALGWDTPSLPDSSSGRHFSQRAFGHLGFTGCSLWIDQERQLSVTLLSNRTWPDRSSQLIRQVRRQVHDAIMEAVEGAH